MNETDSSAELLFDSLGLVGYTLVVARDVILARRAAFIAAALAATASACSESNPQPCLSVGGSPATDSSTGGSAGADAALDAPSTGGSAGNDSDGSAP